MRHCFESITSDDKVTTVWKRLRAFCDRQYTQQCICEKQLISEEDLKQGSTRRDVEKQADQVGMCIQQAQQYFQASNQVDLTTRPNLLYYGIVALSRALVMLCKNGCFSLDYLRKRKLHTDHGLRLIANKLEMIPKSDTTKNILESVLCQVFALRNDERSPGEQGSRNPPDKDPGQSYPIMPWGTFWLFWDCLVPCSFRIEVRIEDQIRHISLDDNIVQRSEPKIDLFGSLLTIRHGLGDLLRGLPDLYSSLEDIGMNPNIRPGKVYSVKFTGCSAKLKAPNIIIDPGRVDEGFYFSIDKLSGSDQAVILKKATEQNPNIRVTNDLGRDEDNSVMLKLRFIYDHDGSVKFGPLPPICQDMYCNHYFIVNAEGHILEPAAHFMIMYCLGMLCRYYPDRWILFLRGNVGFREFLDTLTGVIYRRFPQLLLNQMTGVHHYIHS